MGPLTNDMTRLRDDIDALHNNREIFINDLKHDVAEMQSNFRNDRAEMARKLIGDLGAFVSGLKADVSDMQQGFRNDHAEMARKLIGDLGTFVSGLKADVSDMQQGFRNDRAEMARKLIGDLGTFVLGLKADVSGMQQGFHHDHAEMARKLRNDLGTFASNLNKTVAGLRQEFASDIEGAHQAWFGQAPRERTTREKPEHEEAQGEPEKVEEVHPDDLTEIQGIGPSRQKILNEAGLYTFAQFAKSTPEDIKRALGEMSKLVDVEKWIEQAKELVKPE